MRMPPPSWHGHARGLDDLADDGAVDRLAGLRAVEIDDVEAVGPEFDPPAGDRGGVVGEDGFPRVIALPEPDAAAVEQVDRGVDEHVRSLDSCRCGVAIAFSVRIVSGRWKGKSREGMMKRSNRSGLYEKCCRGRVMERSRTSDVDE